MQRATSIFAAMAALSIVLMTGESSAQEMSEYSYRPPAGFVPDEVSARKIAEVVLSAVYGENKIKSEEPLIVSLKDGVWTVEGSMPSPSGRGVVVGGVAFVQISKLDGTILRMLHGK